MVVSGLNLINLFICGMYFRVKHEFLHVNHFTSSLENGIVRNSIRCLQKFRKKLSLNVLFFMFVLTLTHFLGISRFFGIVSYSVKESYWIVPLRQNDGSLSTF